MSRSVVRLTVAAVVAMIFMSRSPAGASAPPVPPEQFGRLHALIKPAAAEEKWTQIPWLVSLWDARQKAANAGKPILLWEMDGHPLGCV